MTAYVALLRAVNVGGRQLKMADLKAIADELGLESARTYIASGNLLFLSSGDERSVQRALENALKDRFSKPVEVFVRTAEQLEGVVSANPFSKEPGNKVVAMFFGETPSKKTIEAAKNVADERLALGDREIYVHFPSGQGRSKLNLSPRLESTARNMNTVAKLAELAREMA